MSNFIFKSSKGETFTVTGPPDMTQEQANAIFKQQSDSGSLVGLKPGGVLNAASQAAKGLTSALSSLGQQASGVIGALGGKISSAAGQIGSLASKALSSANSIVNSTVAAVKGALTSTTPIGGIDVAKYAKQATALAPIGGMSTSQTTGVLAQAKQIVGQAADKITNNKGVGSYGFDVKQLETAGFVKPGTSALVTAGVSAGAAAASTISSVLKSPSVFTGKDGVKDVNGLLSNTSLQDKTQQGLMAQASSGLKSLGVPIDQLGATNAAGLITSATKSLPDVAKFAKGLPLPPDVKAGIDKAVSLSAYAVKLTDVKIPAVFKEETTPEPAADTANRETVNAATNRVIGNEKIPAPNYSSKAPDVPGEVSNITTAFNSAISYVKSSITLVTGIKEQLVSLENQPNISRQEWDALNSSYQAAKNGYNTNGLPLVAAARAARDAASSAAQLETNPIIAEYNALNSELQSLVNFVKTKLKELEARITE